MAAAPAFVPQQMLPSYAPASPSRGVAGFRPHYRYQPIRPVVRYASQANLPYRPIPARYASAWPIPVNYRPAMPAPRPRLPYYGYRGQMPRWVGYPPPTVGRGYAMPPMPRTAYRYPWPTQTGAWGYPYPRQFRPQYAYPPVAPVNYRPPTWTPPRRAAVPMPYNRYQARPGAVRPVTPTPQVLPTHLAGRYQPYAGRPSIRPDYRFRPVPQAVAYQPYPTAWRYPTRPVYGVDQGFRTDPRLSALARAPVGAYPVWYAPRSSQGATGARPIRREETLAWGDTAARFRHPAY